jgi:hypothetical protein
MVREVLIGVWTPDGLVLVVIEGLVLLHLVEKLDFDFPVGVGEGAVFVVLASLPVMDVALAVFGFVSRWVVQLLNFVMGKATLLVLAMYPPALHVRVAHLPRVPSPVAVVVVKVAAGQLVPSALAHRTKFCLEGLQRETEKLIFLQEFTLVVVEGVADEAVRAGVVVAFRSFILEGVIDHFVHVVAPRTLLTTIIDTSS